MGQLRLLNKLVAGVVAGDRLLERLDHAAEVLPHRGFAALLRLAISVEATDWSAIAQITWWDNRCPTGA